MASREGPHGAQTDWNAVDSLMQKALAAAEKVARYRHAQLSAVRLAGDISGKMDEVSLDELLITIKQEWAKLSPLIDLDAVEEPEPQGNENSHGPDGRARWRACGAEGFRINAIGPGARRALSERLISTQHSTKPAQLT